MGAPGPGSPRAGLRPWGGGPAFGTWDTTLPNCRHSQLRLSPLPTRNQYPAHHRPRQCSRRRSHQHSPQNHAPDVGVKQGSRQQRRWMRRNQPMRNREPRQHRQANQNRRPSTAPCRLHNNRKQQHQPHLEEHRHPHQQAQPQQRPGQPLRAATLNERLAQRSRSSGRSQQLPQNRPHPQDDGDMPHHVSHAHGERERHLLQRHTRRNAQPQGRNRQPQRRMKLQLYHQQQKQQHRPSHAGQQIPVMSSYSMHVHRQIIPHRRWIAHQMGAPPTPRLCFCGLGGIVPPIYGLFGLL